MQDDVSEGFPGLDLPGSIEWRRDSALVPYRAALEEMAARNAAIGEGTARELVWLLEHPPVYTAGTSAAPDELLDPRFEVVPAGRGDGIWKPIQKSPTMNG